MRTRGDKLTEFALGVTGGTLLIAGILSWGSGGSVPRVFVLTGALLIIAAQLIRRRSTR